MFKEIFKRQLIEDIMNYRLLANLVLIMVTVVAFTLIFVNYYRNLEEKYNKTTAENDRRLTEFTKDPIPNVTNAVLEFPMKPRAERFISESNEDELPPGFFFIMDRNVVKILNRNQETGGVLMYEPVSKMTQFSSNLSYSADLTFIIQFLLSFFAIALSFNAATEEREKGTLRLVLSNSTKRASFLLSKYFSTMVTIGLPLLLGLILSILLLQAFAITPISSSVVGEYSLFFVVALVYLSVFVLLGMLCSVFSHSSKHSVVLCLIIWVFLVIIFPKASGLVLNMKRFDMPTEEQINKVIESKRAEINKEYQDRIPADYRENPYKYQRDRLILEIRAEMNRSVQDTYDNYLRKKIATIHTLRAVNFVSPASLFEYSASCVAGTGLFHYEHLWAQVKQYGSDFISYIKGEKAMRENSSPFYFDYLALSERKFEFNSLPKFGEKDVRAGERLKDALTYVSLLIFYNLFLFTFVFYKFRNYDVR
jgi:ABC-type transport system involved in multi-copper enzyme maturation permease subunit